MTCMHVPSGKPQGFWTSLVPRPSVRCAHMYHPESLEMRLFLDYTASLGGLYMACCAGVSPQIPECE